MNSSKTIFLYAFIIFTLITISIDFVNANPIQNDTIINLLLKNQRYQKANKLLKSKLKIEAELHTNELLWTYNQLIITQSKIGDLDSVMLFCQKALALTKKIQDTLLLAKTYKKLDIGYKTNDLTNSIIYFIKVALDLNYKLNDTRGIISHLNTLGVTYNYIRQPALARSLYLAAREKIISFNDESELAINNYNIALVNYQQKNYDRAFKYLFEAEKLALNVENSQLLICIYRTLSDTYLNQENETKWEEYFIKANYLIKNFGNKEAYLSGLCNLTAHAIKNKDFAKAIDYANKVLNQLNLEDNIAIRKRITHLLYMTYKQNGDLKNALLYLEENKSLADNKLNKKDINQIIQIIEKHDSTNKTKLFSIYIAIFIATVLFMIMITMYLKYRRKQRLTPIANENNDTIQQNDDTFIKEKYYLIYNKLISLLEKDEIFKDATIKQDDIVRKLYTNKKYLYYALKECGNTSFKGLINEYRILHAKKLINESIQNNSNLILSEIYTETGFTTNESFYRIFKDHVKSTPGEYLRKKQKETRLNKNHINSSVA